MPVTMTTTIDPKLANWLSQMAKQLQVSKRSLLEKALTNYQEELRREQIKQMFIEATNDENITGLAEDGVSDSLKQIKNLEKNA